MPLRFARSGIPCSFHSRLSLPLHGSSSLNGLRPNLLVRPLRRFHNTSPPSRPPSGANTLSKKVPISSWTRLTAPARNLGDSYSRAHDKHPYITQVCAAIVIYICGDVAAQNIAGEPYSPIRTLRMVTIGALAAIPGYHWLKWLGTSPLFKFKSKYVSLLSKIITQQFIFAPIFGSYFFTAQTLLAGGGFSDVVERLERTFYVTWLNSCKLWPMVTAINFTMISPQHRNVFAGTVGIGWQAYMSWLNQRAAVQAAKDHVEVPVTTTTTS